MVYIINNYSGSTLTSVSDKTVNSTATSLKLPGKDYKPYGEVIVENLVWMLEHFASDTAPLNPVSGQIWYNITNQSLQVYDKLQDVWLNTGKTLVASEFPPDTQSGQIFYHVNKRQLFVYDDQLPESNKWQLIAPFGSADLSDPATNSQVTYTSQQALTVLDDSLASHNIIKISVGGQAVAVWSSDATFTLNTALAGFTPMQIKPGLNLQSGTTLVGIADQATDSSQLGGVPAASYMRRDVTNLPSTPGLNLGSAGQPYNSMFAQSFVGQATEALVAQTALLANNATNAATATNAINLNNQPDTYYTNIPARLGYTPINKAGDTGVGSLTLAGTLTLATGPVSNLQAATKQYVDQNTLTFTTGVITATPFQNTTSGPNFTLNYFDLPPPVGKTVANLVAFIPSIHAIWFSGDVNADDSLHCRWQVEGANIRVWVFNTEQRAAPSAQYLAVWN